MENQSRKLYLHATFSVPERVDGCSEADNEELTQNSATIEHRFDGSNCKPAIIGLPENTDPVKVSVCNGCVVYYFAILRLITAMQPTVTLRSARGGRLQIFRGTRSRALAITQGGWRIRTPDWIRLRGQEGIG